MPRQKKTLNLNKRKACEEENDVDKLMAGVSRRMITPPAGIFLIGYGDRGKDSTGAHDELTATALVLKYEDKTIALVSCDLLYINEFVIDRIRKGAGKDIDVVVSCSHTHSGPVTYADKHSPGKNRKYIDFMVGQIVRAIRQACGRLKPAKLFFSAAQTDIAINRRVIKPDGSVEIGRNPDGPVDRSLNVLSIMAETGERIATVVNCACHATVLGPDNLLATADWVGVMRAATEKKLGGLTLFLQGAAGDLNPLMAWKKDDRWEQIRIQGMRVADSVAGACEEKMEPIRGLPISIDRKVEWLPLRVAAVTEKPPVNYRKHLAAMLHIPLLFSFVIDIVLNKRFPWRPIVEAHNGNWSIPLRINFLHLGELEIVTFSAEVFTETGMKIKKLCPAKYMMFGSVTDGSISYLPTCKAFSEGGFEVTDSPFFSRYPGQFNPDCEKFSIEAVKSFWESGK